MTQEEKARAYDEALEKARKQRDDYQKELDKTDKNSQLASLLRAGISAVEMIFPQLRESEEDEKRVKQLIYDTEHIDELIKDCDEQIAWLKAISLNHKKFNEAVEKLCSNEWSKEDEEMRNALWNLLKIQYPPFRI